MTKVNEFGVGDRVAISTGEHGTVTLSKSGAIRVRWDNGIVIVYTAWQVKTMPIVRRTR